MLAYSRSDLTGHRAHSHSPSSYETAGRMGDRGKADRDSPESCGWLRGIGSRRGCEADPRIGDTPARRGRTRGASTEPKNICEAVGADGLRIRQWDGGSTSLSRDYPKGHDNPESTAEMTFPHPADRCIDGMGQQMRLINVVVRRFRDRFERLVDAAGCIINPPEMC